MAGAGESWGFWARCQMDTFVPTFTLLKDVWCAVSRQTPLIKASWNSTFRRAEIAGWVGESGQSGFTAQHPLGPPRPEQSSRLASLASPRPGALPAARATSMAPGRVQKATLHAPSRRTKGHIDWFVGAFPGVLYISLPCCCNEEAESTEEGRGRHTCIRVGFLHLINQDFN